MQDRIDERVETSKGSSTQYNPMHL